MDLGIEYIVYILQNYGAVMLIMITIIEVIMYLIKKPIKLLTQKIKNEKLRLIVNKMFIIMTFALSFLCYFVANKLFAEFVDFDLLKIVLTGAFSVVFYSLGDGVFKKIDIKEVDEAARKLVDTTNNGVKDGVIETHEVVSAVDAFNELCDKIESDK